MSHPVPVGQLIDGTAGRDAIHVAIAPACAAHCLRPGETVGFVGGEDSSLVGSSSEKPLGIVDPFLPRAVARGEWFYLFLFPNTITTLRHEWTHPAFGEPRAAGDSALAVASKQWIEGFADRIGMTYRKLMEAAENKVHHDEYHIFYGSDTPTECYSQIDEFWRHYEAVTGKPVPDHRKTSFFSCSC